MRKDPKILVDDIRESIETIQEYINGYDKKAFFADRKTQDAVFKRIENMGEATKRLPKDFRDQFSGIPWKKIAGMRDILIHEYFGINVEKVWIVVSEEIPILKEKITKILAEENQKKLL